MSFKNKNEFSKMCRLCISEAAVLVNIFPKHLDTKPSTNDFLHIIERFTTIKISPTDDLPQKICQDCIKALNSMLQFQNKCKRSEVKLQEMKQDLNDGDSQPTIKIEALDVSDTQDTVPDERPESLKSEMDTNDKDDFTFRYEKTTRKYGSQDHNSNDSESESVEDTDDPPKVKRWRPQKVACHICGKLYEAFKIQFHMNNHNGLKPYECDESNCISKFASPQQLNRHKKLCHIAQPSLFCDVCGRGFKVRSNLQRHRSYHFDPELPCTVCEKLFRNSRALKKHMLVHSQERKFPCDLCKKSFQTKYTLRIHSRVHTQEKPYSCNCGTAFAYKCLLKAHVEKCHKETNSSIS